MPVGLSIAAFVLGAAASLAMGPQDHEALSLLSGYNKGLTCLLCA